MRLYIVLLILATLCLTSVSSSNNVLVLIENLFVKESHSSFFTLLSARGFNVTIKVADDPSVALMSYGEYIYSHIIILSPSVREFGGSLNVKSLVEFFDNGGNLVVVGSNDVGEAVRELGSECGVEFDEMKTNVIDHFNFDVKDDGLHTLLAISADNLLKSKVITGRINKPLLYRGIGISADPNNPLLIDILHGYKSTYCYDPFKKVLDYPNSVGSNTQFITGLQARNNARALFIGSMDFLSDSFFDSEVQWSSSGQKELSGNKELTENLLLWVLGERGQLRYTSVEHHCVGATTPPAQYTIMDDVVYKIKIETKDESGNWVPYDADDVQLEFVRIDPFVRKTLRHKDGIYSLTMKLPDVYGVFKFVVDYHRLGYTHLTSVIQVPVRPFTHTQYERFIMAAYPYYCSALSMIIGMILFSFLFLYYKDDKEKNE